MVNATEMAKLFGKKVSNFTRLDTTKSFIKSCLKSSHVSFLEVKDESNLIVSTQNAGTSRFICRILCKPKELSK